MAEENTNNNTTDNNQNQDNTNTPDTDNNNSDNNNNNTDDNNSETKPDTSVPDKNNNEGQKTDSNDFFPGEATSDSTQQTTDVDDGKIHVNVEPNPPKKFTTKLADVQAKGKNLSRANEKGLINEQTGSALAIRDNGQVNTTSGLYSQYKLNPNGKSVEQTLESNTISVRKKFAVNEFVINEHKLNPNLYEFTDFRNVKLPLGQEAIVGNFTLCGTVLVKAWEPNLKRYMLIRRPVRMPMFSNLLNVPDINTGIKVDDPLKVKDDILAKSDKGYQVNAEIKDEKSLVGKEGVNRGGSAGTGETSGAAGNADMAAAEGVMAGFNAYNGQKMPSDENGCVEAVVRIGSYFSKFLKAEYDKGENNVPNLIEAAKAANIAVVEFSASNLAAGDTIVYSNSEGPSHVVIYTGTGTEYVGNSSSQHHVLKGSNYNEMGPTYGPPSMIIKTSNG